MRKRTAVIWSATWTLLALLQMPTAYATSSISEAHAQKLISLSGLNDQLEALPQAVLSSFNQLIVADGVVEPFEPADIPELQYAVASVFNAQALQASIVAEMMSTLSNEDAQMLTRFYSTKTGVALRTAERDNSLLESTERFEKWYQAVGFERLVSDRQQAIRELERAMQATLSAVDAMIGMQLSMQISLTPVLPADEQLSAEQLVIASEQLRPGLTETYYESSLETLAFVFKDQPLDTLHAYAAMLKTPAGQRYVHAVNDGLSRGLFGAAQKLGVSVRDIVAGRLGQGA